MRPGYIPTRVPGLHPVRRGALARAGARPTGGGRCDDEAVDKQEDDSDKEEEGEECAIGRSINGQFLGRLCCAGK